MRRLLPLVGAFYALLAAHPASAEATGRVFTCHESSTYSWKMTQPQEHADAGLWPKWSDCLAWRNGDPGPTYVWSYGEVATTTTSSPATTIPETTIPETTVPETTTTLEATTTTVEETTTTSSTTTTTSSTTTTQPIATSTSTSTTTSIDTPIQTIASTSSTTLPKMSESTRDDDIIPNIENTSTSSSTSTTAPNTPITPETLTPDKPSEARGGLAEGASNGLAPGVTPEAQRAIVAASLGLITSSAAASRRRT